MSLNTRRNSYTPKKNNKLPLDKIEKILLISSLFIYLLLFPPFLKNQTLAGHDVGAHLSYLRIFTDALSQGQFPVRWIEWASLGQNQPLFNFYQPLLYYLASIPRLLGVSILNSMYLSILTLWLVSGYITFLFAKNLTKSMLGGAVASLVYVFAPYHILDVFVRTAYPEVTALAFTPGIFYALERYFTTKKSIYLALNAIFFAAVFVSHPPTLIMFSIPVISFLGYLIYKDINNSKSILYTLKSFLTTLLSFCLGFGLSAFFSMPAFLQQNLIKSASLNVGYLDFHNHYVCLLQLFDPTWNFGASISGCSDQMSFQFGIINWIVLIILISTLIYLKVKKLYSNYSLIAIIFIFLSLFGMYMTTSFSQSFWEQTPYLAFIQFTWRFLAISIFSVAILAGLLFTFIKDRTYQLIIFTILAISIPLSTLTYIKPAAYLSPDYFSQDSTSFYQGTNSVQKNDTAELGYMPKNVEVLPLLENVPASQIHLDNKDARIEVVKNNFDYKEWIVKSNKDTLALVFIHNFPGWKFKINGQAQVINSNNIYDFVYFNIPAGQNKIVAEFEDLLLVKLSNLISLISLIITITLFIFSFLKIKSQK